VCVISILHLLNEALYLWNVHHVPLEQVLLIGAASRIRRSISYKVKESISSLKGPPPAGLRATTRVTRLVLSGTTLRRKRHKSVMSSVMGSGQPNRGFALSLSSAALPRPG
jgi:hypothetical protein